MAFNLASARPVEDTPPNPAGPAALSPPPGKFNLATAKPVTDLPGDAPEAPGVLDRANAWASQNPVMRGISSVADSVMGIPELAATAVSGMVGDVAGKVAGLGAIPLHAAGLIETDPADVQNNVSGALTLQPQTQSARSVLDMAAKPFNYVEQKKGETADIAREAGGQWAGDLTQAGLNAAQAALEYLPGVKAARAAAPAARVPSAVETEVNARPRPANTPEERARALGLKVRPSDVQSNTPGQKQPLGARAAEGMVDSQQLGRDFSIDNQAKITTAAAKDIGLPDGVQGLDTKKLDTLRKAPEGVYNQVGALPQTITSPEFNTSLNNLKGDRGADAKVKDAITSLQAEFAVPGAPKDMLASIKTLRSRARKRVQSDDVAANEIGYAEQRMAGLLEDELERVAVASGNGPLLNDFRAARRELAKINTVDDALKAGQVDAAQLLKAREKGAKLDGRLAAIADAAEHFPHVTRHPHAYNGAAVSERPSTVAGWVQKGASKLGPEQYLNKGFQNSVFEGGDEALAAYFNGPTEKPLPAGAGAPNPFGGPEGPQAADLRARGAAQGDRDLVSELLPSQPLPGEMVEWDQRRGGSAPMRRELEDNSTPTPGWDYPNEGMLDVPDSLVGPPVGPDMALLQELGLSEPNAIGVAGQAPQSLDELLASVFGPDSGGPAPVRGRPFRQDFPQVVNNEGFLPFRDQGAPGPDFDTAGLSLADDPFQRQAPTVLEDAAPPGLSLADDDAPPRGGPSLLDDIFGGESDLLTLFRGVADGQNPMAANEAGGRFFAPSRAQAENYGPNVAQQSVGKGDVFDAGTIEQLRALVAAKPDATIIDLLRAYGQQLGRKPVVSYTLPPEMNGTPREYFQFDSPE